MKAILISDHAKWCALMMNGDKTIELRTSKTLYKAIQKLIDENGHADIYVYCSKGKDKLFYHNSVKEYDIANSNWKLINFAKVYDVAGYPTRNLNGKVLFKFRCYKVEKFDVRLGHPRIYCGACVGDTWCIENHYHDKDYNAYAIHISDLEIFDKPKELSEFKSYKKNIVNTKINGMVFETELDNSLIKAPQNYCYVEVE